MITAIWLAVCALVSGLMSCVGVLGFALALIGDAILLLGLILCMIPVLLIVYPLLILIGYLQKWLLQIRALLSTNKE